MQKNTMKRVAQSVSLVLAVLLSACSSNVDPSSSSTQTSSTGGTPSAVSTSGAGEQSGAFSYPMDPVTLTCNIDAIDYDGVPDWAKPYYKWTKIEEMTGVTLQGVGGYTEGGGNTEAFFLMLAAGDLPDLMYNNWIGYPGGPEAALDQKLLIDLNETLEKYCPNLNALLEENPEIARDMRTDSGKYYVFPFVRRDSGRNFYGIGYRQDKLDELGLTVPQTPDELEHVLRVFKENGMETGLTFEYRFLFLGDQTYGTALQSGFGIKSGFWVEDGKIHYGEAEPAYEEFVTWLHKLYAEGLIDPDMPSIDKATSLAKFSNGSAWAAICMSSEAISDMATQDNGFIGTAGPSLSPEKGAKPKFGQKQGAYSGLCSIGISPQCKNIEAAARYLDWHYGQGAELIQIGTEGFTYAYVDGKFTKDIQDLIQIDHPDAQQLSLRTQYGTSDTNWPMWQDEKWAYFKSEENRHVHEVWSGNDMDTYRLPPLTLSDQEAKEYSSLLTDLETYIKEQVSMFIIGTKPLSEFENFRKTLTDLGIDRVLEIQQAAYDRYLQR